MTNRIRAIRAMPAYGRSYETVEAAIADWNAGKDFRQTEFPGTYFSARDAQIIVGAGFNEVIFCDVLHGELGSVFL